MNRRDRRGAGRKSQTVPNHSGAVGPDALYEAGLGHLTAGRFLDAQVCCEKALAADAGHADALHLMGLLCLQAQQYDHVLEWVIRAISRNPKPVYLATLGTALRRLGRHDEALKAFDKVAQVKPEDAESWRNLGNALLDLQRSAEALLSFQHSLTLDPHHWEALHRCGVLLRDAGRLEEALVSFDRCEELRPDHPETLHLRAATFRSLDRFEAYLADSTRLHQLEPAHPAHCNNIGDALVSLARHAEALVWFDKALDLEPDAVDVLRNKAACLRHEHRLQEAAEVYEQLKRLDPNNAAYDRSLAYTHLTMGNFEAGWSEREARFKIPGLSIHYPNFSQPQWFGKESIEGKTLLVYADEGLGDALQFARYLPLLADRGARVLLAAPDALCPLLSGIAGVAECQPYSLGFPAAFDMYCPMGSLPLAFATRLDTIPAVAYMQPVPIDRVRAWEERLGPRRQLRAGLVWSGNPKHNNDRARSLPLQTMARLFDTGARFISLQKEPRPGDKEFLGTRADIVDLSSGLTDFVETAALISCLDLVITVDTSVAHLSATLGRPTWILLPYGSDWRWLLDRDDSPWYPMVRLFRQTETRDYESVVDRVRVELSTMISRRQDTEHQDAGRQSQTVANKAGAVSPDALYEAGLGHLTAGRFLDAQICCEKALAANPSHADALHLMGLLRFQAGQYDHAVEWIARAISANPKPEYLTNLGRTLRRLGRNDEALKVFDKVAQLAPDDAESWANLARTLVDLGRPADALLGFQHALKLRPLDREAMYLAGVLLHDLKRPEEALGHFDRYIELQPDDAATLLKRALVFIDLERFEEAVADFQRAHALDPGNADTCNNAGHVLVRLRRYEEALVWFDKAIERRPQFGIALHNKATALRQLGRLEETLGLYRQVISLDPGNVMAELALAHINLTMGNFEAGWRGHEARLKIAYRTSYYPKFPQPMWRGEGPIEGKTFLIYAEEGLGDSIQFARYIPMLAARGARVILVVQEAARALLSGVAGVEQCLPKSIDEFPAFDFHCAISSLPLAFGTRLETIPAGSMYLPVAAESRVKAWQDRLGPQEKLRVGLVWSGNPGHKNDLNRSIPLRMLTRILDADATFVSLQKDPRSDDRAVLLERTDIIDMTGHLTDFAETAALIGCLDLVITVDTSVAHLAGALGCPTWIMLPYVPDWRWLMGRDDSPWYPAVRLFRQTEARDYDSVLDRVRAELRMLISARRPASE